LFGTNLLNLFGQIKYTIINIDCPQQYKFAPDLIALDAYETVESWTGYKNLKPGKLIPAMMCYSSEPHAKYCILRIAFSIFQMFSLI